MKLSNNLLATLIVSFMINMIVINMLIYERVDDLNKSVTGDVLTNQTGATGNIKLCIEERLRITTIIPNQSMTDEDNFTYDVNSTGKCLPNVTFSIYSATIGNITINSTSGIIFYEGSADDVGDNIVTVTAAKGPVTDSINFTITIVVGFFAPEVDIEWNTDNYSIDLNWTNVSTADYYNIYAGTSCNSTSTLLTNVTSLSYTDAAAGAYTSRFYRVGAVQGATENLSEIVVGKWDVTFVANELTTLYGRNWFSNPFNVTYYADPFVLRICDRDPTLTKLNRDSAVIEDFKSHTCFSGATNNFSMVLGDGFEVFVNETTNYTLVGECSQGNLTVEFISDAAGAYGRNWFGTAILDDPIYADPFVQPICDRNPTVTRLDRSDSATEDFLSHTCVSGSTNNFSINETGGYELYLNSSYNYTIN